MILLKFKIIRGSPRFVNTGMQLDTSPLEERAISLGPSNSTIKSQGNLTLLRFFRYFMRDPFIERSYSLTVVNRPSHFVIESTGWITTWLLGPRILPSPLAGC